MIINGQSSKLLQQSFVALVALSQMLQKRFFSATSLHHF